MRPTTQQRTTVRPTSQSEIDRLYADPATSVELSAELIEHHIKRGRMMRAQAAAEIFGAAARGLKRLVTSSGRRPAGRLTTSSV